MYCSECGAKNKKTAEFCEECGAKLEPVEEEKTTKKVAPKKKTATKKLSKKQKIIIVAIVAIVVVLFIAFQVLKTATSPKKIVEDYIEAINTKDYAKLYDYANYSGDTTFISEKVYTEAVKNKLEDSSTISNFTIGKVAYENGGLTAVVTVNSNVKLGSSTTGATFEVKLTKAREKQYLFFPKWTISEEELLELNTVEDFNLTVPKDTEITFGGVKVTDKYLNNDEKDDYTVTYTLPQVLTTSTNIDYKLPGGLEVEQVVNPSSYNTGYSLNLSTSDISEEDQKKLTDKITETTNAMMKGIVENKTFNDIKSNFANDTDSEYYKELEDEYADYRDDVQGDNYVSLSNFDVDEVEISSIGFTRNYELSVFVRLSYSWTETDKDSGETTEEDDYSYHTFYLVPEDDEYKIVGISSFPATISWYW